MKQTIAFAALPCFAAFGAALFGWGRKRKAAANAVAGANRGSLLGGGYKQQRFARGGWK